MRKHTLQEYFYYTRSERNASIILGSLCFVFFLLPDVVALFSKPASQVDFTAFQEAIATVSRPAVAVNQAPANFRNAQQEAPSAIQLFPFDPNTASREDLILLGMSPRLAQTIVNYRAKGGKFYKKEDLKKIYILREEDYARLEAWVQIQPPANEAKNSKFAEQKAKTTPVDEKPDLVPVYFPTREKKQIVLDINQATAEEWQQLKGIGPGFSRRIVNFREKLGGFSSLDQVGETKGLPDSTFQKILPSLQISPVFRKIRVNTATLEELKSHPYLSNFQATILLNYRLQHGAFSGMESLRKINAGFKDEDWKRMEPYLSFE